MVSAISPIHATPIAGVNVRFYAAPDGRQEVPWHSFMDICAAAGLSRDMRSDLLQRAHACAAAEIATTPDGTIIESHGAAIALIGALIDLGAVPSTFGDAYRAAGIEALEHLHAGLSDAERFERMKAMAKGTLGACEGALDAMYGGAAPAALVTRLRTVVLVMHDAGKARPS